MKAFAIMFIFATALSLPTCDTIVVKTCRWSLGKFPEAKKFIENDLPLFGDRASVDYKAGGPPRFACFGANGVELETVDFSAHSRKEIRALMNGFGFQPQQPFMNDEL